MSQSCFSPNLPPAPPPTWCDSGDCHQTSDGLMSHPRNLWHPAQGGRWQVPWRISWEMGITKRHVWVLNQILGLDELVTHLNTLKTHILYIQDAFLNVYWAWTDVICACIALFGVLMYHYITMHYAHVAFGSVVFIQLDLFHSFFASHLTFRHLAIVPNMEADLIQLRQLAVGCRALRTQMRVP